MSIFNAYKKVGTNVCAMTPEKTFRFARGKLTDDLIESMPKRVIVECGQLDTLTGDGEFIKKYMSSFERLTTECINAFELSVNNVNPWKQAYMYYAYRKASFGTDASLYLLMWVYYLRSLTKFIGSPNSKQIGELVDCVPEMIKFILRNSHVLDLSCVWFPNHEMDNFKSREIDIEQLHRCIAPSMLKYAKEEWKDDYRICQKS